MEENPDGVARARDDLIARGKGWRDKLERALRKVEKKNACLVAWLREA